MNVNDDFRILKSGDRFLWTSWRDGHTHIYLYSFNAPDPLAADAKLERQLESGDYEVIAISGVDEKLGTVFFIANKGDPRQKKLFSVKLDGSGMQSISSEEGEHTATFADDGKHFVETYSATLTPPRISVCAADGRCQKIWESRSVAEYDPLKPEPLEFKADDGTVLYGYLILPRHADASQKVPLIVYIYGGPAGQTVQDAWGGTNALFHQLLANEGFAVFSVDNRGTPNRGKKFSAATRLQSGAGRTERPAGCARPAVGAISAARPHSYRDLGMVEWRLDDALRVDAFRALQGGNLGGAGDQLARLRFDLHRALHGTAQGQQPAVTTIRSLAPPAICTGRCCWCMGRATTMCISRIQSR